MVLIPFRPITPFPVTPPRLPRNVSLGISPPALRFKIFLGIERENLADAAIQVEGCQEVRKDLQLTLGVFLEWLRENLDDVHSCQFEYIHPCFFFSSNTRQYRSNSSSVAWWV